MLPAKRLQGGQTVRILYGDVLALLDGPRRPTPPDTRAESAPLTRPETF